MRVELLTFPSCPHAGPTRARVLDVLASLAPDATLVEISVRDRSHAEEVAFLGSPSVRIDGEDLESRSGPPSMSCRLYGASGTPPRWLVEAAVLRTLRPRGWLFLCVANSARSQLAEGIARQLAPDGVRVASAGSEPTSVRPEARTALAEVGIDAGEHHSKGLTDVDPAAVEAVVTLCAEEACPAWLHRAHRVHWALPDPAAVEGEGRLDAFRATRDELRRRLGVVFAG